MRRQDENLVGSLLGRKAVQPAGSAPGMPPDMLRRLKSPTDKSRAGSNVMELVKELDAEEMQEFLVKLSSLFAQISNDVPSQAAQDVVKHLDAAAGAWTQREGNYSSTTDPADISSAEQALYAPTKGRGPSMRGMMSKPGRTGRH